MYRCRVSVALSSGWLFREAAEEFLVLQQGRDAKKSTITLIPLSGRAAELDVSLQKGAAFTCDDTNQFVGRHRSESRERQDSN